MSDLNLDLWHSRYSRVSAARLRKLIPAGIGGQQRVNDQALICPTTALPAVKHDHDASDPNFTIEA